MINSIIRKVFKRKASEVPNMYDFRTITVDEVGNFPNGLKKLKSREIDGFIVKQALSVDEVSKLDKFARNLEKTEEDILHTRKGFVYPFPFASAGVECPDVGNYFSDMKRVRNGLAASCGVDIEKRLFSILGKMSGGREIAAPAYNGDNGSAIPFTVRYLNSVNGVVEVHCGNLFHGNHSVFYDHVNTLLDSYDQLSFFFVIQPSESSDLILLDKIWKEGQSKDSFDDPYIFKDEKGNEVDCSDYGINRMTIKLEPGDFLTFAGGPIWHVVEHVKGSKGRITVGGFMGFSNDDRTVYCWS